MLEKISLGEVSRLLNFSYRNKMTDSLFDFLYIMYPHLMCNGNVPCFKLRRNAVNKTCDIFQQTTERYMAGKYGSRNLALQIMLLSQNEFAHMKVACRVLIRLFLGVFITGNVACISKEAKDLDDLIGNADTFDMKGICLQSIFFLPFLITKFIISISMLSKLQVQYCKCVCVTVSGSLEEDILI